mgnify:CR=1 FL=1
MHIVFFGTASMVPTKTRNHSGIFVREGTENILVDCGEGTQRQFRVAGIPPPKITRIFLTHWHGDHFFGLPGLLENLSKNHYAQTLHVYGPKGSKKRMEKLLDAVGITTPFPLKVHDITKNGVFLETNDLTVTAMYLKHSVPCLGYRISTKDKIKMDMNFLKKHKIPSGPLLGKLQQGKNITYEGKKIKATDATYIQKGKTLCIIVDTALCDSCYALAKNADVLICESTYTHEHATKAKAYLHLTSTQAATIAKKAKVKKLFLTHYSQRYNSPAIFKKEARKVFKHTEAAEDFTVVDL